jgi:hypothetical protein
LGGQTTPFQSEAQSRSKAWRSVGSPTPDRAVWGHSPDKRVWRCDRNRTETAPRRPDARSRTGLVRNHGWVGRGRYAPKSINSILAKSIWQSLRCLTRAGLSSGARPWPCSSHSCLSPPRRPNRRHKDAPQVTPKNVVSQLKQALAAETGRTPVELPAPDWPKAPPPYGELSCALQVVKSAGGLLLPTGENRSSKPPGA